MLISRDLLAGGALQPRPQPVPRKTGAPISAAAGRQPWKVTGRETLMASPAADKPDGAAALDASELNDSNRCRGLEESFASRSRRRPLSLYSVRNDTPSVATVRQSPAPKAAAASGSLPSYRSVPGER
jgi:hypothetical protein